MSSDGKRAARLKVPPERRRQIALLGAAARLERHGTAAMAAMGALGGRATAASRPPEVRRAVASKAGAVGNRVRWSCRGRVAFVLQREAQAEIGRRRIRYGPGPRMAARLCEDCRRWHIVYGEC